MAYSPSEIKVKRTILSQVFPFRGLSLRSVKRIVVVILACIVLAFLVLWRPMYLQLRSLQKEKIYWQNVKAGSANNKEDTKVSTIPTMDQFPDMIDQCRGAFVKEGVAVYALNVERFGERREVGNGGSLDYGLVRLRLHGQWKDIVRALKAVEEMRLFSIHVQEVLLEVEGGEVLLQIYFCTGV
ncbi:hypothetical protein [Desulfosporosinus metallidurans]|nr:hypothetical protein [Desulfosporosinus metallidurans]